MQLNWLNSRQPQYQSEWEKAGVIEYTHSRKQNVKASKNRNTNKQGMNKKLLNSPPQCYTDLVDEDNATETQAEIKQHCLDSRVWQATRRTKEANFRSVARKSKSKSKREKDTDRRAGSKPMKEKRADEQRVGVGLQIFLKKIFLLWIR